MEHPVDTPSYIPERNSTWSASFSGCGDGRLSGTASVQFLLNKIHVDGDTCRKSVDNSAYSFSV